LTPDERSAYDRNYAEARRILLLLNDRLAEYHETRGRALDLSRITGGGSQRSASPAIDAREAWCLSVAWALYANGKPVAHVLHARLTRRQKSAENSWARIASEVEDTSEHVERIFKNALPIFLLELDARKITTALREDAMTLPSHIRCAARDRGHVCAEDTESDVAA
jgi:hypothetical protein